MQRGILFTFLGVVMVICFTVTGCAKKDTSEGARKIPGKKKYSAKQLTPTNAPITEERVIFSFEKELDGWEIPDWAMGKDDHVAGTLAVSKDVAIEGSFSAKMACNFRGAIWTAAHMELEQFYDFTPYREIAVDIYVPKEAPLGLKARIILTVGDAWTFTEMNRSIPLVPGEWISVKGNIEPGSYDWKRINPDESFRADVRKIAVRVESNKAPVYKGPVYVDNVRIGK